MSALVKYAGNKITNALVNKALNTIGSKYKGRSLRGTKTPVTKMKLYKKVMDGTVHLFKQKVVTLVSTTLSATGYYIFAKQFQLSDLPNFAEYTALFDSYKIHKIKYQIVSVNNSSKENEVTVATQMFGGIIVDPDDASVAGWVDFTEISQYNDWHPKKVSDNRGLKRYFTPAVNNQIQAVTQPTYISTMYKPLLDMASPTVPHLGIKGAFLGGVPLVPAKFYETVTYYIECRTKR